MKDHSHYHKDVSHLKSIDVYRVLSLFNVTDPCIQHAVKKLLVTGSRGGGKSFLVDVQEAIDSLKRCQVMIGEDMAPIHNRRFEIVYGTCSKKDESQDKPFLGIAPGNGSRKMGIENGKLVLSDSFVMLTSESYGYRVSERVGSSGVHYTLHGFYISTPDQVDSHGTMSFRTDGTLAIALGQWEESAVKLLGERALAAAKAWNANSFMKEIRQVEVP